MGRVVTEKRTTSKIARQINAVREGRSGAGYIVLAYGLGKSYQTVTDKFTA